MLRSPAVTHFELLPHHAETLERTVAHFQADAGLIGLVLGGSLSHGFASSESDVDILLVVSDEEFGARLREGRTCFFSSELATYPGGYVDGKYICPGFVETVATRGSEPARYAFQDARVLFSKDASLSAALARAGRYPVETKADRILRFQAQFEAWHWYSSEAFKRGDLPLLRTALSKLTLFGGRILLAHNELLYPFHKWFMRVLEAAPDKPAATIPLIHKLAAEPTRADLDEFARTIREFRAWQMNQATWPPQFMQDTELAWLSSAAAIDEI